MNDAQKASDSMQRQLKNGVKQTRKKMFMSLLCKLNGDLRMVNERKNDVKWQ